MKGFDFAEIVRNAWDDYGDNRAIRKMEDVSAMVSTNHVFKLELNDNSILYAKYSYFGFYKNFKEDHAIIYALSQKLESPYENFLAQSLLKDDEVYTYRHTSDFLDAWVVFYKPIEINQRLPRRLKPWHIAKLAGELAKFHKACYNLHDKIPASTKTLESDICHLFDILKTESGMCEHRDHINEIRRQCDLFLNNIDKLNYHSFCKIPVFIDWNIGNFSVTEEGELYSRWDYDWFRMCSRVVDFYFFSRIVSHVGDKTSFSYYINPLMEERFLSFLKEYHKIFPLTELEIRFIKEAYRFFILNYVIKDGRYFFLNFYANKLQKEAYEVYFPQIDKKFKPEKILKALEL